MKKSILVLILIGSTPTYVGFEATGASIDVLNEASVLPAQALPIPLVNAAASGRISFAGNANLDRCFVESNIAGEENFEYLAVRPKFKSTESPVSGSQFSSSWSKYENHGLGNAVIRFGDNYNGGQHYRASSFEAGRMIANEVFFENPFNDVSLELATFEAIRREGIHGWSHPVPNPGFPGLFLYNHNYSDVIIDNCRFEDFDANNTLGIHLQGFEKTDKFEDVRVQNNWFIRDQSAGRSVTAGIFLEETSASVLRNWVAALGFKNMLINTGRSGLRSNSFICDNTLRFASNGGEGAGLTTKFWQGYAKLNRCGSNDIGHRSQDQDLSAIIFSRYYSNPETGLLMTHPSTTLDLSGVSGTSSNQYAAYDTLDRNNTNTLTLRSGQINLNGSTLIVGTADDDPLVYQNYGQNTFIVPLNGNRYIVNSSASSVPIGGINRNFWGYGSLSSYTSESASAIAGAPPFYFGNVSISYDGAEPIIASDPIARSFEVSCGNGFEPESSPNGGTGTEKAIPESGDIVDDTNACEALYERARKLTMARNYQMAYDTGRYFIENCANTPRSFRGFSPVGYGAQFRSDSIGRYNELREWIKQVLYLNTSDPLYYCAGVSTLFISFNYVEGRNRDYEGMIALYDYLTSSGKCPEDTATYIQERRDVRNLQYQIWADTVKDSLATPFDTTKVTLEELGLGWVKGQSSVAATPPVRGKGLIAFRVSENPFRRETELEYEIDMDMRVRIEIFDVLGRRLLGDDIGLLTPKGRHSLRLPGDLPNGVLMARISTGNGEIKTLQLRKIE